MFLPLLLDCRAGAFVLACLLRSGSCVLYLQVLHCMPAQPWKYCFWSLELGREPASGSSVSGGSLDLQQHSGVACCLLSGTRAVCSAP
jgi:hypothetical protein